MLLNGPLNHQARGKALFPLPLTWCALRPAQTDHPGPRDVILLTEKGTPPDRTWSAEYCTQSNNAAAGAILPTAEVDERAECVLSK
jgi:hypothetical protein